MTLAMTSADTAVLVGYGVGVVGTCYAMVVWEWVQERRERRERQQEQLRWTPCSESERKARR